MPPREATWPPQLGELAAAVVAGDAPIFHPNTGQALATADEISLHAAAAAGLDVPRYCQLCGRRVMVQVRPDGWLAHCSRDGDLDSAHSADSVAVHDEAVEVAHLSAL